MRSLTNGVIQKDTLAAKARYNYLPFGAEISSSYGSRSQVAGYAANEVIRQKYTGYERDTESGLDFAEARYYYNTQGRFISADSVAGTATSPQSLNRYTYTGNNPVNNVDPSGHVFFSAQFNGSPYGGDGNGGSSEAPDYVGGPTSEFSAQGLAAYEQRVQETRDAVSEAEQQQQQLDPSPPPALSQQQGDEMLASAAQYGPIGPAQNTSQNPVNVNELGDPPPLYPPQELAHCNPDVIKQINAMRGRTLTGMGTGLKQEAGFRVDPRYKVGELIVGGYSSEVNVGVIPFYTWSKFHTHIASGGVDPSDGDRINANKTGVVVYVLSRTGLRLYNPKNRNFPDGSLRIIDAPVCPK